MSNVDEYLKLRASAHEEQMLNVLEQERRLQSLPYLDNMPFVFTPNRRQCRDIIEQSVQWGIFVGLMTGISVSHARYSKLSTPRRSFYNGLAFGCFCGVAFGVSVYFMNPFCQPQLRGDMQLIPPEMRFKNYIDEKYKMYDNADAEFYRRMTISDKEVNGVLKKYGEHLKERKRTVDEAVDRQIKSGQVLNKDIKA
ncbi:hypothetical protein FGO68_gene361 [Halteria grandinella]|uniref:Uncharacterized protein n=1 Tax=Halteria grandinella TaxID=5974 RepID=A0A8J8NQZ1_HALGN|nr:hypothetical protein FGO68_gene361 [Halteria grandinella]